MAQDGDHLEIYRLCDPLFGWAGRAKDMALESLAYLYFIQKDIALLSSIAYYWMAS